MSKLILKQEISGKHIPNVVRSFLMSAESKEDSEVINEIKRTFNNKLKTCQGSFLNVYMYLDDSKPITNYNDITVIIELHDKYHNGQRED